jgi:hypothetical protein
MAKYKRIMMRREIEIKRLELYSKEGRSVNEMIDLLQSIEAKFPEIINPLIYFEEDIERIERYEDYKKGDIIVFRGESMETDEEYEKRTEKLDMRKQQVKREKDHKNDPEYQQFLILKGKFGV